MLYAIAGIVIGCCWEYAYPSIDYSDIHESLELSNQKLELFLQQLKLLELKLQKHPSLQMKANENEEE